ncbi:MAG: hypothetical protein ACJ790_06800 [Myxococcaceae bacterium]
MSNPIARLHHDIQKLHQAQKARHNAAVEQRKDQRAGDKAHKELTQDKRAGDKAHKRLDSQHKTLVQDRKALGTANGALQKDQLAKSNRIGELEAKKAMLEQQYQDSFDPATGMGDPAIQQQITDVAQKETDVAAEFDQKLSADQQGVDKAKGAVDRVSAKVDASRKEILSDRKAIKQDRNTIKHLHNELKHDKKALDHAQNAVKSARHTALKHLRPAEYKMGLKSTNRVRHELGLKSVSHVVRPMNTNTVQGCAQFLLHSPNVSFWTGLSSGSDRKNLELLAHGKPAFVPATGGHVFPKLSLMQALVDMAKHGRIQINALTGGTHSPNSNHYHGTAVDLDINVGNTSQIVAIANRHGGFRNFETDHIHLDF